MALDADPAAALLYGVDLRLTDDGDLALSSGGDLVQAIGLVAAAQAVVSRFKTPPNTLPLHPDYGSDLTTTVIGAKAQDADMVLARLLTAARRMAEQDRRFSGLTNIEITSTGVQTVVAASVVLARGEQLHANDLGSVRTDELALDPSQLADLAALGDSDDAGLLELVAGIASDDPDYGDVTDISLLLDDDSADVDLDQPE